MSIRPTTIGTTIVFGLILLFGVACSGDDQPEAGVAGSARSGNANSNQITSQNVNDSDEMEALLQELPGAVAYMQGDTLMLLKFSGDLEPIILADNVRREAVAYVPDGSAIVYQSNRRLFLYRPSEDEPTDLGALRFSNGGRITSWSPNREWFLWQVAGTTVYNVNGTASYDLSSLRSGNRYEWTTDNQLLIIDDNGRQGKNFAYRQVTQVNLDTGETEPIDVDLDAVNDDNITIEDAISAAGYDLIGLSNVIYPAIQVPSEVLESPSIICNSWTIADGNVFEDGEVVYQSQPIYMLSELKVLSEDQYLFLKWTVEDCRLDDPVAELVRYHVETRQEEILSPSVMADRPPPRNSRLFVDPRGDPRYTVSPDGQFILWLGGGIENGVTTLNLINLADGSTTLVLEHQTDGNLSTFVNNLLLSEVYWLGS